ncbi:type I toxin-antitoxin system SymE family toxin [Xanthomonas sp. PPL568]|uniref:SymE family type I addiction module toxin n=1 Tax=Xanthomonas indica TaxID=2912242 RepID=UPI001F56112F|nr:SymE family type I addiction module toxin [Xanthomonas indica]MCI2245095.1 type I toxin-antitoxin system SymE family toxin [Xanthomonas indica]
MSTGIMLYALTASFDQATIYSLRQIPQPGSVSRNHLATPTQMEDVMSDSAAARSKTKSPRCAAKAPPCWLKLEFPGPLDAIAAEPLPSASAPPLWPDADKGSVPKRSMPRRPKQCTIGYRYYDVERNGMRAGRQVPSLRLYGLWLEGIGFAVGGKVRITMANGALLIPAAPAVSPPAAKKRRRCEVTP